jgi:hypothetical protein
MRRTLLSLAAASAVALGGLSAAPQPAHAFAWWVAPAIAGGVIAGGALGAGAASSAYAGPGYAYAPGHYAYAPGAYYGFVPAQPYDAYASDIYVRSVAVPNNCFWARQRVPGGWQRVRVCD